MSSSANAALVGPWKDLWNGDLSVTDKIIAEDFVAHAAPITGTRPDEIRGRDALNAWVSGIHAILPDLTFAIDVGPITDDEHLGGAVEGSRTCGGASPARHPMRPAGRSPSPAPTPCASPTASWPSTGPTPTASCSSSSSAYAESCPRVTCARPFSRRARPPPASRACSRYSRPLVSRITHLQRGRRGGHTAGGLRALPARRSRISFPGSRRGHRQRQATYVRQFARDYARVFAG